MKKYKVFTLYPREQSDRIELADLLNDGYQIERADHVGDDFVIVYILFKEEKQ